MLSEEGLISREEMICLDEEISSQFADSLRRIKEIKGIINSRTLSASSSDTGNSSLNPLSFAYLDLGGGGVWRGGGVFNQPGKEFTIRRSRVRY